MAILPGKRLGPYEILSAIGAGGMGEVYRAKDTRLNRIVAIKVLPSHLADSPELRERFEREARTIASLNHPHICTLHDIGHQNGTDFLVMEYLEGETLAQRLVKGPLALDQVLQYAIQIADALDKAHRKGVTHRDLKPGNIMLTKSGTKLLDFGLAKLQQEVTPANVQLSQLPTANEPLTAQGTIVGTLQYMAPEQLEGKQVDSRTDIFAFGTVIYEMATRQRAFEGKSQASVISAIMSFDPAPISTLQPMTPPALDRVVKKCLAKEPDERWQTATDLRGELKWIAESSAQAAPPRSASAKDASALRPRWLVLLALACVLAAALATVGILAFRPKPSPAEHLVTRTVITLPSGQRLIGPDQSALALSRDGKYLAYAAIQGNIQQLYLRPLDSAEAKPVPGTDGAVGPAFSPDGQWLGFFAGGKLKKVSVNSGAAVTLSDAANGGGLTWGSQGTIIFETGAGPLEEISDAGGAGRQATGLEKGENFLRWPEFLPDGKAFLFTSPFSEPAKILIQAGSNQRRNLIQSVGGFSGPARYVSSGYLLYVQAGTLMAAPFDLQRLEVKGAGIPLMEGVAEFIQASTSQWSISATGSLAYVSGGTAATQARLVWVDRSGKEKPGTPPRGYGAPRISPDGRYVATEIAGDVWIYDAVRGALTRLTFQSKDAGNAGNPIWTPDGKRVVFRTVPDKGSKIFWQLADGSGPAEELTNGGRLDANSFSPDGKLLAFTDRGANTGGDIWVLCLSDRKAQPFLQTPANEMGPQFSPDEHWLAYVSDKSGRNEIYVQPYPGPGGGKWQISTEGGNEPAWNPNGRELFYRNGDKMIAVEISTQPNFSAGKPKVLFEGRYVPTGVAHRNYDVSPDGQRFLMVKDIEEAPAITQINLVQNWFEELKQKVPVGMKR
jgi:Tol biopolymer transport system component